MTECIDMKKIVLLCLALLMFTGTLGATPWIREARLLIRDMALSLKRVNDELSRAANGAAAGKALGDHVARMNNLHKRTKRLEKMYPQITGAQALLAASELAGDPMLLMFQKETMRYARLMQELMAKYMQDPGFMAAMQKASAVMQQ